MELTIEQINRLEAIQLTPEEILLLRLRAHSSVAQIAAMVGYSRQYTSLRLKEIREKLKAQKNGE